MLPTITNVVSRPGRLWSVVPVALALLLLALPSYAATSEAKGAEAPEATCPAGGQCFADVPAGNSFYEFINRIYQQDLVTGYPCGGAGEPCDAENRPYYRPGTTVTRQQMAKFIDNARRLPQILIDVTGGSAPVRVTNDTGTAIAAFSTSGQALTVQSQSAAAIYAQSGTGSAVYGFATSSDGVGVTGFGDSGVRGTGSLVGVYGHSSSGNGVYGSSGSGWAGYFNGNINVSGNCSGCAGPTRIDHPLDPENKYLYHSTVQSPDMKNVYDGNVTTDDKGEAVVVLPDYFEALNRDFRYQLTVVGQFAQAIISQQVKDNRFTIKTDKPNVTVSWQVTGIRQDPYANAHRTQVEVDKPAEERGKYVHPTEWGQPEAAGIDYEEVQKMQEEMQQAGER